MYIVIYCALLDSLVVNIIYIYIYTRKNPSCIILFIWESKRIKPLFYMFEGYKTSLMKCIFIVLYNDK